MNPNHILYSHNALLPLISDGTRNDILVKEKRITSATHRDYSIRLQGVLLFAVWDAAKKIGVTPGEYMKSAIEKDLVRGGWLPKWWYTRKFGRVQG